jgi:hypothetical protein
MNLTMQLHLPDLKLHILDKRKYIGYVKEERSNKYKVTHVLSILPSWHTMNIYGAWR